MSNSKINQSIEKAAEIVGTTWPLYSFVTSNPLVGFEKNHFCISVKQAENLFGARAYPEVSIYRQAWQNKEILESELNKIFDENGIKTTPADSLKQMETETMIFKNDKNEDLDRILIKWLGAFMDEGLAEWEMPNKSEGFFKSWRKLAKYDNELLIKNINDIPNTAAEVLENLLKDFNEEEKIKIFKNHIAALPGWTGYIKHRNDNGTLWQKEYPITLEDYLAVRIFIANQLKLNLLPKENLNKITPESFSLRHLWLKAWEASFQKQIATTLEKNRKRMQANSENASTPDAQFALCIDTRSEAMRRHIESAGNYETFGYAGFFGIAMDYKNENDGVVRKACPPIVGSAYLVSEIPQDNKEIEADQFAQKIKVQNFKDYFLLRLKNMLPSAFGYVEGSGIFYGFSLFKRTLFAGSSYRSNDKNATEYEKIYKPSISSYSDANILEDKIPLAEKVAIVKGAFDLTGWTTFAPLILFVGHASHSANNPFASGLDCGACAASPGRHNARMLAKLANSKDVQKVLKENYSISIPHDTVFIGAEHNTTTDEIVVFDADVPNFQTEAIKNLKINLIKIQKNATAERLFKNEKSVAQSEKNANNWAETRPEWGLAKNSGFFVGPRSLTKDLNLDGRCFLHSYDWKQDMEGAALEGIMQGPMVVTQWINNHYYFSTVDNDTFGGGSKITHNITGKFGVVQGNGGDLKMGLPLESIRKSDTEMYHQPLRLSVIIQAPIENIDQILTKNENVKNLIDNEWIYLLVMDPNDENKIKKYSKNGLWKPVLEKENFEKINLSKIASEVMA